MADGYSYVALLDVLGYRAQVASDRARGTLDFKDKLSAALGALHSINEDEIRRIAISDTVILSTSNPVGLSSLLDACKTLFLSFMRHGLMLRGGVAYSQHFNSGNVTYSHALTLAHALESQSAIWPRVLIDKGALEASKANGVDLAGTEKVLIWNDHYLLDVASEGAWEEVYACAKKVLSDQAGQCPEDVFTKFLLLERFLLAHPKKPQRKGYFSPVPTHH